MVLLHIANARNGALDCGAPSMLMVPLFRLGQPAEHGQQGGLSTACDGPTIARNSPADTSNDILVKASVPPIQ